MAAGILASQAPFLEPAPVDTSIFHDGFKTSGQMDPIYSLIQSYENFPKEITGPTVWKADEFRQNREKWTYSFAESEVAEIGAAADSFIAAGTPLTGITKESFPLPTLEDRMRHLKKLLIDGQGFWLFKGLPVQQWGLQKSATAYMGLGTHLGYFTSQNGKGHVLGHVKDLGEDATKTDRVRIYRTNARQYFHTDASDIVGLLCMAKAQEGGESDIVSVHHVFNVLQREHPDVARTLCEPIWYFDRKGEVSRGQGEWMRVSVFYLEPPAAAAAAAAAAADGAAPPPRLYAKFDPNNVTSLARFSAGPDARVPPLSEAQRRAIGVLEAVCLREALHMVLDPGDVQFLANSHVFHARTAYQDFAPGTLDAAGRPRPQRHLLRLWLSVPLDEGGWRLPYPDAKLKKRGGIQVDDTPPVCPLDAE